MLLSITHNSAGRATGRLLSGTDDGQSFEVKIPLRCKTVEQALDWLVPDGAHPVWRTGAKRQGDLWFVPELPPRLGKITEEEGTTRTSDDDQGLLGRHQADEVRLQERWGRMRTHHWVALPVLWVRGQVQHPHHATLDLGAGWHRVVPDRAHGPFRWGGRGSRGSD